MPCFESSLSPHCGIINYRKAASSIFFPYLFLIFFDRISIETDLYRDLIWWLDPLHYVLIVQINWPRSRNGLGTQFSFMTCEPIASGNNGPPSQSTRLKVFVCLNLIVQTLIFTTVQKRPTVWTDLYCSFTGENSALEKSMSQQQKWPNIANLRHLKSPGIRSHF